MHKRSEIKDAVVEMLRDSGASFANVYKSRYLPVNPDSLPVASVYCPEETSEKAVTNEHYNRTAKVAILVYCKGYDASEDGENSGQPNVDSELDDLTAEVESVFFAPIQTLGGVAYQMSLLSTKYMVDDKAEDIIGVATMEFSVEYKDSLL